MTDVSFSARLQAACETMPRQLRTAARWVHDNPREVALLTMREQARRAGVAPASMTRLAQRIGFDGYETLRAIHVDRLRRGEGDFSDRTEALLARRERDGEDALAYDLDDSFARHLAAQAKPEKISALIEAARALRGAGRIHAVGYRSSYSVAYYFTYVYGLAGGDVRLLDGPGGTGPDGLRGAGPGDALLAVSVKPYTRAAVELIDYALSRGLEVVAITDSALSPLARKSHAAIIVATESPSFFHTMAPAFAAAEALASLLAAAAGECALAAVRGMERQFDALSTHMREAARKP
jgi:DNA-binding MurR/RpiR family transcriptional regulator